MIARMSSSQFSSHKGFTLKLESAGGWPTRRIRSGQTANAFHRFDASNCLKTLLTAFSLNMRSSSSFHFFFFP